LWRRSAAGRPCIGTSRELRSPHSSPCHGPGVEASGSAHVQLITAVPRFIRHPPHYLVLGQTDTPALNPRVLRKVWKVWAKSKNRDSKATPALTCKSKQNHEHTHTQTRANTLDGGGCISLTLLQRWCCLVSRWTDQPGAIMQVTLHGVV